MSSVPLTDLEYSVAHIKEGFSQVLGSSRCFECSNDYLSLLIPFAIAGIVLLFVLNLTVSVGTINGLIFYANIVKINETIFFPPGNNSAFISWLNLDLGIETCFYDRMNSLGKNMAPVHIPILLVDYRFCHHYNASLLN